MYRLLAVLVCVLAFGTAWAEVTPSVTEADFDLPQCAAFVDGKPVGGAPTADMLKAALGIIPKAERVDNQRVWWTTGAVPGRDRHFRIAFKQPVSIGTIITTATGPVQRPLQPLSGQWVSYLKPDAAYPGDLTKDDQWMMLPPGQVKTLPPSGIKTRALRLTQRILGDTITPAESSLPRVVCLQERYYNALNIGGVKRSGRAKEQETWMGVWQEPQSIAGICFMDLYPRPSVEILKPTATRHALVAPQGDWRRLPDAREGEISLYRLDNPLTTRAVRLIGGEYQSWNSNYHTVIPLAVLGNAAEVPTLEIPPPPFRVKYGMPLDGFAAVEIHDKTGVLVRRIVGEVARPKGPVEESWDLKDENGNFVPPGEYTMKAIARPPFHLTWQTTVYNAGEPAWWYAPKPGFVIGSWLADHTPPDSAEAMGDTIWLGAQVTESGNIFIAVDKDGHKQWGEHAVSEGFSGPERIATDGRYGYLVNDSLVQRVDPKDDYKTQNIFNFHHTLTLPGNGQHWDAFHGGAVARGDKLYVSYWAATESWLKPSFKSETIDPNASIPFTFLKKGNGRHDLRHHKPYGEGEYDELMKLYAALLTETTPDGAAIPSSTQAVFGDAPEQGPLAGWVMVAFKAPVSVGSIMLPSNIKVQALKEGMDVPSGDPEVGEPDLLGGGGGEVEAGGLADEANWVNLPVTGKANRPSIALAPEGGITTKALRFQVNRLKYALVTARRFADIADEAERVYADGQATQHGGWSVKRPATTPISEFNPAMMALVWPKATLMRGISLHLPSGAYMYVEKWIGPENGDPKASIADDTKWQTVGAVRPMGSWWAPQVATLGSVDFGEVQPIRALRVRAIAPEGSYYEGMYGTSFNVVTSDHIAGFDAVVAYRYLGGDPKTVPVILSERISEYQLPGEDGEGMKELRQLRLKRPGNLVFDKAGQLYAVSDGQIVTVPLDGGDPKVVTGRDKLEKPSDLAFDSKGQLYVADCGPNVIKVFDVKTGNQVRVIGTPGGQKLGAWDPMRFDYPTGLTIDANDKLWICDHTYQPKRVQRMSTDGAVEKIFLGPTQYGGGGIMDPQNKSVVNYNGMKFVINWADYSWKLDSILFRPSDSRSTGAGAPDRVFYHNGKRYLVDAGYGGSSVAVVCREANGIAVPLAAMGNLGNWDDVKRRPDLRKAFGALQCKLYTFLWWDKNGDGTPQADEVQTEEGGPAGNARASVTVGEDLAFIAPGWAARPTGFQPDGRPMYDLAKVQSVPPQTHGPHGSTPTERVWGTEDGRTFVIGDRLIDKDGKTQLWEYFDRWAEHEGFYHSAWGYNRPPGSLNQEHSPIGHFFLNTTQGKKEEFFVTNSDQGDLFCFTGDGMLAGCLFGGPAGYGLRRWTMPEWEHNKTNLDDVRLDQEHYQGWAGTAEDGKLYVIAGHNHASVVRVDGLEQLTRLPQTPVMVAKTDVGAAQAWDIQRLTREKLRQEPKVAKMPFLPKPIDINGSLDDWPDDLFVTIHDEVQRSFGMPDQIITYYTGALAFDDTNLYVASWAKERNRLRNTATEPIRLFKSGDAIDVTLGLDTKADPTRTTPVAGDLRILITEINHQPMVVVYRPVVPGTPTEKAVHFTSPVGMTTIDVVAVIPNPDVKFGDGTVEAAIPWAALGVTAPKVDTIIRGDIGVLVADQNGVATAARYYWSGKAQTMVCDVPGEARLAPSLWGEFYCTEPDKTMKFGPDDVELLP